MRDMVTATLQTAASVGNGLALEVSGLGAVGLQMVGAAGADRVVNFEGSLDGTTYVALMGQNRTTLALAATATQAGTTPQAWLIPVAGLRLFRARLSGGTTGTVTVTAAAVTTAVTVHLAV